MKKPPATRRPVVSALALPQLDPLDAEQLSAHESYDARAVTGGDISKRDLTGAIFTECSLTGLTAHGTSLKSARIVETRLERWNAPVLTAIRSTLRDVEISGSRFGALDIYDAEISSTRFVGCKFDWINLRSSQLEDVIFEDCTMNDLDLGGATAQRVTFTNCRAGSIALPHARLQDVDLRGLSMDSITDLTGLRGATLDSAQVSRLADAFASHLGIRVED